jgi:hypothetical protein
MDGWMDGWMDMHRGGLNFNQGSPLYPVTKRSFLKPFLYKMHHFAKTGSGQT